MDDKLYKLTAIEFGMVTKLLVTEIKRTSGRTSNMLSTEHLTDACRIVFNLFVVDAYNHERTARLLNISIDTSKSLLTYARKELERLISTDK
jgi:DNA-directed RNA polymerase specialized sigma24 family protein